MSKLKLPIDKILQKGIEAHKAGRVTDAHRFYSSILKVQPKHPDANHNMGVLTVGIGNLEKALTCFRTALDANPRVAQFWYSYIDILIKLGSTTDAKAVLIQARTNGAKGDSFDQLELKLEELSNETCESAVRSNEKKQTTVNILDRLKLDQAISLAKRKTKGGFFGDAKRIYQDILLKFPNNKRAIAGMKVVAQRRTSNVPKIEAAPQDKIDFLIKLYGQSKLDDVVMEAECLTELYPGSFPIWNILGIAAVQIGKFDKAILAFQKVIFLDPNAADAYCNMAIALTKKGKIKDALEACATSVRLNPNSAQAYNTMGNALRDQGKLEEALDAYRKAVAIKPINAEAHNNMGVTLKDQGKLKEALEAFTTALKVKSNYADAHNNMGVTLKELGKPILAIKAYKRSLFIEPKNPNALFNLGNALKGMSFEQPDRELHNYIISLLNKRTYVRPKDIIKTALDLLACEPVLQKSFRLSSTRSINVNFPEIIVELEKLPLLLKLMSVCPLPNISFENLLKDLRANLLFAIFNNTSSTEFLKFQIALALQCFTNEYIYDQSEDETKVLKLLEERVNQTLCNGDQPSPEALLCLASYKSLSKYEWSGSLHAGNEINDVYTRQILEPNQEYKIKTCLPVLLGITDEVSSKVRDQYEESPYPRWVDLGLRLKPAPIFKIVNEIKLKIFDEKIKQIKSPSILIAGCGTGQHSIATAARFSDSSVLAIDISLSSLSYAKRKTEELGVQNIDYMQADILDLGKLNRQFDIVESAGVLHHMNSPMDGWKVLVDCLKPGGLMKIGLYSESARQHIVKARHEIADANIGASHAEMRLFRTKIIDSEDHHHKSIRTSTDFYSMSELRDLLFHVQEHRFTIGMIGEFLSELGLKFCGFEADKIVEHFKLTNPQANDLYDLAKWQAYESSNPRAFAGMYQFWCQKIGTVRQN